MAGIRNKILLVFYVVVTGIVLLYFLFPTNAVKDHLASRINQNVSGAQVDIGSLGLRFPMSLSFGDVSVIKNGAVLFSVDRVKVSPKWFSLLTSRKAFRFKGLTYQGGFSGTFWAEFDGGGISGSASGSFSEIMLGQLPVLESQPRLDLSGNLSGSFQIEASTMAPANGSGNIVVTDCNLAFSESLQNIQRLLNIEQFEFEHIHADLFFEGGNLEIANGELEGAQMNGSVAGSIFIASPMSRSDMDLEIAVTPLLYSSLSEINELTFRVTGTFENPNFSPVPTR
jgi:type II secretion system protein N